MHQLCHLFLASDVVPDVQLVCEDAIPVDFTFDVLVLEEAEAQFVVLRDKVVAALTRDSQVQVSDLAVVVHEHHVEVEKVDSNSHQKDLNDESQKVPDKALSTVLEEIIVEFKYVSILVLDREVCNGYDHKVENGEEAIPKQGHTSRLGEAEDVLVGKLVNLYEHPEEHEVSGRAHHSHEDLLIDEVVAVSKL